MAAPLFRAVIGHVISFRDGASFGWWLFGVRDYSIKMTTRDNKKTGKIYRRRITQQTELAQRYREHQDVCPGPSRIVMRQLVDRGSSRSMDGVPNELARRSPAQRYVFEDNQDDGSAQTSNDASHGNVVTAVAGLESRYRNVHNCNNHEDVSDCLRDWAVDHEQSRSSVNEILAIFRARTDYELPKDARTLMKTSTKIGQEIEAVADGEYWYKGIEKVLLNYYQSSTPEMDRLSVHVSVDGLPLHKSSSTQVWPILMKLEQIPEAPVMMVAMFCGTSKPNDLEPFLRPFVLEANELSQRGLRFGDKIVCFNIRAIIADSPARAFLKATTNFNGLHGCLKCTCVGEFLKRERKVIFDSVGANSRTDAGFRSRECPDHHQRWRTPLEDLFSGKLPLHCS